MMGHILRLAAAFALLAASFALGGWYAYHSVFGGAQGDALIYNGKWYTSAYAGSAAADAKTRAYIAATGLLALPRRETVYFRTDTDMNGDPITSEREYEIIGNALPARWWSLTLYNYDHFITPDANGPVSVKSTTLETTEDGSFRLHLSRHPQEGNWIAMGTGRDMSISMRLYNPDILTVEDMLAADLPIVRPIPSEAAKETTQ